LLELPACTIVSMTIDCTRFLYAIIFPLVIVGLISCGQKESPGAANTAKDYPVLTIVPTTSTLSTQYPATIEGQQNIEIRPKIDGYIEKIFVDEGAQVKKGQKLFQILAPQYEQEVRTAEANIKIAEANVKTAEMEVNKVKPLVKKKIISAYELESAEFNLQSKKAVLAQARATLANASVNLSYTIIESPANGVIGTIPYRIGSLVSSNTPQPLTTVSNIENIYAYFSINEKQALEASRSLRGKTSAERIASLPPVKLILSNGMEYTHSGRIETASGLINTSTGSLRIRATFPNPDNIIRSGSSGMVLIPATIDSAILIPQKSTYEIQGKKFVYKVSDTNTVHSTEIKIMDNTGGQYYVVQDGLKAGDKIVLEGVAGLREGMPIVPTEIKASEVVATEK
jgi:membrane fusion protein (multidrug efflux system)